MLNNQTNGHKMTTAETILSEPGVEGASERKNSNSNNSNGSSSCNSINGDASHEHPPSDAAAAATTSTKKPCGIAGKPILNQINKYLPPPPGVHLKGKYSTVVTINKWELIN